MVQDVSIAELREAGIALTPAEAIAIVQQLIHQPQPQLSRQTTATAVGPPSAANVRLTHEGFVFCRGYDTTPAVFEMAILLQSLLLPGTARGGLRYAVARALLEVDVQPFDSVDEFSETLARFEHGDRRDVVRGLMARWVGTSRAPAFPAALDRRRSALTSDLRRHLREADARLYEQALRAPRTAATASTTASPRTAGTSSASTAIPAIAACLLAGAALIGAGEFTRLHRQPDASPAAGVALAPAAPAPVRSPEIAAIDQDASAPRQPAMQAAKVAPSEAVAGRSPKLVRHSDARSSRADTPRKSRRSPSRHVLEKLRLQWLKKPFTVRSKPL